MRHLLIPMTCIAALLSACGGGTDIANDSSSAAPQALAAAPLVSADTTLQLEAESLPDQDAQQLAVPAYDMAPVVLDTPDDNAIGADAAVHTQAVPGQNRRLASRRLTLDALRRAQSDRSLSADSSDSSTSTSTSTATAMASSGSIATFTPAQIRAAYGLPTLPSSFSGLSATQAAQLGAGQTIYIVNAQHDPNLPAELAAFNTKFGLPSCTTKTIATSAALPLASASKTGCELSVVYSTAAGGMTNIQPAYDAGWATEIALDVQWAHATAPLARIVLIEANSASYDNLLGGVKLANAMGPGVVSMSFGGAESSGTSSADSVFSAPNMTYLAATGDAGAAVSWPSVSPKVLAVGGTTLNYSGSGLRSETVWSSTGGGVSQYVATPSYQSNAVPGMGSAARRTVADVAFNANPSSGQYVALITYGGSTVRWASVGGTSLATPQWAGLIAVANALRVQNGKAVLAQPHAALYTQISTVPGTYASAFADVTSGSNGSCTGCTAQTGYDLATGLGTPNAAALLSTLSGLTVQAAPVVTSATINGKAGTALSFSVSATGTNALSYTLSGAPSGMSVSSAGVISWAKPVAGSYSVTVTAKDSKNGMTGQGVYTVVIAAASASTSSSTKPAVVAPVITATSMNGVAGTALTGTVRITDASGKAVSVSISGAPVGMTFSVSGMTVTLKWAAPVAGSYQLTFTATNAAGGSTQLLVPVTVSAR